MELSKIPTLVVGLIVAILIVTVVAIPIISDSTQYVQSTAQNADARYMLSSSSDEAITLEFANNSYKINGIEYENVDNYQIKAFSNAFFLTFNANGSSATINDGTHYSIYNVTKLEYDPSSSTATAYHGGSSTAYTDVEQLFYLHPRGDYAYFASAENIHISNDSEWFALISAYSADNGTAWGIDKYVGKTKSTYMPGFVIPSSGTGSAATLSYTLTFDQVDSKHFDITGATDVTANSLTFSGIKYAVPVDYLEISTTDNATISIINIIPLLLIVSMIIAIVSTALVSRSN